MAIIETPGAANANSYGSMVEATAFFANRAGSDAWNEAQSFQREQALIQATIRLDEFDYIGDEATTTQALKWPRIINDTYEWINDEFPFGITEIPLRLKYAQFETAFSILESGGATAVAAGTVDSMKIGDDVEIKYASGSSAVVVDTTVDFMGLPIKAARFLKGLRLTAVLA